MKAITILIALATLFSISTQANQLMTGPMAKNLKIAERLSETEKTELTTITSFEGPKSKNVKSSERLTSVEKNTTNATIDKGPRAKNKKRHKK